MTGHTRALYFPGRDPAPDGQALPVGCSSAAEVECKSIRDELAAQTPKSVWDNLAQHDAVVEERMRTMTIAERTDLEISLTKRRHGGGHTYDYDALSYDQAVTYDPLPTGADHLLRSLDLDSEAFNGPGHQVIQMDHLTTLLLRKSPPEYDYIDVFC